MEKNTIRYILDIGLVISFLAVALTGIFKFSGFREFLGISISYRDAPMPLISTVHDWSGVAMSLIVMGHLILNWDWMTGMTRELFRKEEIIETKKPGKYKK